MTQKNQTSKASLAGKLSALTLAIGAMSPMLSACSHGGNEAAPAPSAKEAPKAAPSNPCAPQAAAPSNPCAPQAQNPCAPHPAPAMSSKTPTNPCAPTGQGSSQG